MYRSFYIYRLYVIIKRGGWFFLLRETGFGYSRRKCWVENNDNICLFDILHIKRQLKSNNKRLQNVVKFSWCWEKKMVSLSIILDWDMDRVTECRDWSIPDAMIKKIHFQDIWCFNGFHIIYRVFHEMLPNLSINFAWGHKAFFCISIQKINTREFLKAPRYSILSPSMRQFYLLGLID